MYKPIKISDIPRHRSTVHLNRIRDIEHFIASGEDACEIILEKNEKASHVSGAFRAAIKRRQYYNDLCEAFMRGGRVFLVRKRRGEADMEV